MTGAKGAVFSDASGTTLDSLMVSGVIIGGATQNFIWLCQGVQTIGDIAVSNVKATTTGSTDVAIKVCNANSLSIKKTIYSGFASGLYDATQTFTNPPVVSGVTPPLGWTAYTPTLSCNAGSLTTTTPLGRWKRITDKTVAVQLDITLTNIGTCSGSLRATLPFTSNASIINAFAGQEFALTGKALSVGTQSAGSATMVIFFADGTTAWANGQRPIIGGTYETQ